MATEAMVAGYPKSSQVFLASLGLKGHTHLGLI